MNDEFDKMHSECCYNVLNLCINEFLDLKFFTETSYAPKVNWSELTLFFIFLEII